MNFRVRLLGWFALGCLLAAPGFVRAQSTADLTNQDSALTQQLNANAAQTAALESKLSEAPRPASGWLGHSNLFASASGSPSPNDTKLEDQVSDLKTKYNDLFEQRQQVRDEILQQEITGAQPPSSSPSTDNSLGGIISPLAATTAPAVDWAKEALPKAKVDSTAIETASVNEPPGSLVPLPKSLPAVPDSTPPSTADSTKAIAPQVEPEPSPSVTFVPPPVARVVPGLDDPTTNATVKAQRPEVDAVINGTSTDSPAPAPAIAAADTPPPPASDPNQPTAQASKGVDWTPILIGIAAIGAGTAAAAASGGGSSGPVGGGSYAPMRSGPVFCH